MNNYVTYNSFAVATTYKLPTSHVTTDKMTGFTAIEGVVCCGLFALLSIVAIATIIGRKRRRSTRKGILIFN